MARNRCKAWAAVGLALWACLAMAWAQARPAAPATDLRVLIDVSGSMRHNDPDNLRRPALRLLVNLLPRGSRAGVWTFARYVNMQVPLGTVDAGWRARARAESKRIGSPGQYTDIEAALRRATVDWKTPAQGVHRTLILLTDGMVDLGKDPVRNKASRDRILHQLLPRLKRAGVTIHTVALSDSADQQLLSALALGTDGWFEKVHDAGTLQRIFMRLFQQSVPMEALPLRDNRFSVDASVQDMTVVVFGREGAPPVALIGPKGAHFDAARHPHSVRWHHDTGYDMVTVSHPEAGAWRIRGAVDPDNRVLVVTNLRLQVEPLPGNVLLGEQLVVHASLRRDGKTETDADFLKLAKFTAQEGSQAPAPLRDDGKAPDSHAADGRYAVTLTRSLQPGAQTLVVAARGPTFEREWRHVFQVHAQPAELSVDTVPPPEGGFRLIVTPHSDLLDADSLKVVATAEGGDDSPHPLTRGADGRWTTKLPSADAGQMVTVEIDARLTNGRATSAVLDKRLPAAPVAAPKPAAQPPSAAVPPAQETAAPAKNKAAEKPVDWLVVTLVVLLVNLLLIGAGVGGYYLWRWYRRRQTAAPAETGDADDGQ